MANIEHLRICSCCYCFCFFYICFGIFRALFLLILQNVAMFPKKKGRVENDYV